MCVSPGWSAAHVVRHIMLSSGCMRPFKFFHFSFHAVWVTSHAPIIPSTGGKEKGKKDLENKCCFYSLSQHTDWLHIYEKLPQQTDAFPRSLSERIMRCTQARDCDPPPSQASFSWLVFPFHSAVFCPAKFHNRQDSGGARRFRSSIQGQTNRSQ